VGLLAFVSSPSIAVFHSVSSRFLSASFPAIPAVHQAVSVYQFELHNNALSLRETPSRLGLHNNARFLCLLSCTLIQHDCQDDLREYTSRLAVA
jgi:hypothetical protein